MNVRCMKNKRSEFEKRGGGQVLNEHEKRREERDKT